MRGAAAACSAPRDEEAVPGARPQRRRRRPRGPAQRNLDQATMAERREALPAMAFGAA